MPSILRLTSLSLIVALTLPWKALADAAPDTAADLAAITLKANGDRNLQMFLQQMGQLHNRPEDVRRMMDERLYQYLPNGRPGGDGPVAYRIAEQVQQAQVRAQIYSQILTSDLNDDGSISKQEVKDTLSVAQVRGAAEAFFSADANDDSILAPDEIRAAVDLQAALSSGRRGANPMALFDFDDDGVLTPAERDRGMAALGLITR